MRTSEYTPSSYPMGFFTSAADKAKHRQLLAQAGHLIAWVRSQDVRTGQIAVELRGLIWPLVNRMQEQLDDGEKHVGESDRLKELREDFEEVSRLVAGNVAPDVRVNLRTEFFDHTVERIILIQREVQVWREEPGYMSASGLHENLSDAIADLEMAGRWFSEPPEPRTTKHTVDEARAGMVGARESLVELRR